MDHPAPRGPLAMARAFRIPSSGRTATKAQTVKGDAARRSRTFSSFGPVIVAAMQVSPRPRYRGVNRRSALAGSSRSIQVRPSSFKGAAPIPASTSPASPRTHSVIRGPAAWPWHIGTGCVRAAKCRVHSAELGRAQPGRIRAAQYRIMVRAAAALNWPSILCRDEFKSLRPHRVTGASKSARIRLRSRKAGKPIMTRSDPSLDRNGCPYAVSWT